MTILVKTSVKTYFETETWKSIPGKDPYLASSLGRIKNDKKGNILTPIPWGKRGHVAVRVGGGRKARKQYVHRLVLMAFAGLPNKGQIACHKNDIKTDNRLDNLYWGTYKTNAADSIRLGSFNYPNPEDTTLYDAEIIRQIKIEYTGKRGEQSALAKKYNMSVSNVHLIVHGKTRVAA